MKYIPKLYFIIICVLILSCSNNEENTAFTIIHMNDTHSKNKEFVIISKEDGKTNRYGGAARRKTFIDKIKKQKQM